MIIKTRPVFNNFVFEEDQNKMAQIPKSVHTFKGSIYSWCFVSKQSQNMNKLTTMPAKKGWIPFHNFIAQSRKQILKILFRKE